jgi:hypothetical protein
MLGRRKVKKMLGYEKTDLESKLNKIVNTEVIDTSLSHTLQKHMKVENKKQYITPNDVFEGKGKCPCDEARKSNKKKNKSYSKNAKSNGRMEKK